MIYIKNDLQKHKNTKTCNLQAIRGAQVTLRLGTYKVPALRVNFEDS